MRRFIQDPKITSQFIRCKIILSYRRHFDQQTRPIGKRKQFRLLRNHPCSDEFKFKVTISARSKHRDATLRQVFSSWFCNDSAISWDRFDPFK